MTNKPQSSIIKEQSMTLSNKSTIDIKQLKYFIIVFIISLLFTLIESQVSYAETHYKTRVSIQVAEVTSFVKMGWLWFSPLLLLVISPIRKQWYFRVPIILSPFIITLMYYKSIIYSNTEDINFDLYAGYYTRYPYYTSILFGIFSTCLLSLIITEILSYTKRKKTHANRMFKK